MSDLEMPTIQSNRVIREQPQEVNNVFRIAVEENILQTYECKEGLCGPTYTIILTDARIIQRFINKKCCCVCDHTDSMLFLSDISYIKDRNDQEYCCSCDCCCCCCVKRGMSITLGGAFGKEVFTFDKSEINQALANIPIAALPHKITKQNYVNQPLVNTHGSHSISNKNSNQPETF